jgi:hypothetical protein
MSLNQIQKLVLGKFKKNLLNAKTMIPKEYSSKTQEEANIRLIKLVSEQIIEDQHYRNLISKDNTEFHGKEFHCSTYCFRESDIAELIKYSFELGLHTKEFDDVS